MIKSYYAAAWKEGISNNMEGEGRLLGGLFVIGPKSQGIIMEYKEKEFGDAAPLEEVTDAVKMIE